MPKPEKIEIVSEIKERLKSAEVVILTNYQGLTVAEINDLRKRFREAKVDYRVYKNTLTKIAVNELGYTGLDKHLEGPTAIASSPTNISVPSKVIRDFIKQYKKLEIKAGIFGGKTIDIKAVESLADLPAKEVLLAQFLGALQTPTGGFLSVLQAPIRNLIYLMSNYSQQKTINHQSLTN